MKYHVSEVARILGITPGALHFLEGKEIIEAKREKMDTAIMMKMIFSDCSLILNITQWEFPSRI
ncbi:hypothetical protein CCDG5_0330 [[Clostridium] cellulosi]|uniref:Uncharacterized protein n=1 Tax=[Clostridium] cellulosi TaxID=29343 RepID=A0A078KLW7_9FIRM|nr:hypothetical protein CCDG5_0330 [[Clostridium] cellulosi]